MTDLIPGKRYRVTLEGRASIDGDLILNHPGGVIWAADITEFDTIEPLPDPLPTAYGSVILDRSGDAWQRRAMRWVSASTIPDQPDDEAFRDELGPFTILFDAGAEK